MIQRCLWCCAKLSKRLLSVYRKNTFIVLCALSPFRNPISGLVVSLSALWFRVSLHVGHTFSCASPVGAVRTVGWPWVLPAALCACPTSLQPRSIQCYTSVGLEPWKRRGVSCASLACRVVGISCRFFLPECNMRCVTIERAWPCALLNLSQSPAPCYSCVLQKQNRLW